MKTRTSTTVGALHPVLFFAGIYLVVLLLSIFICSTIFYSCNSSKTEIVQKPVDNAHANTSVASVQ
jgi:hypothetical protein